MEFTWGNLVGQIIKSRRQELDWSQQELAEKTGYTSKAMISDIERGKCSLPAKKVAIFAEALGVEKSTLEEVKGKMRAVMPGPGGEELKNESPGEIVKIYRRARGLTHEGLSAKIETLPPEEIDELEKNESDSPQELWAVPIAHCLGIPEEKFIMHVSSYRMKVLIKQKQDEFRQDPNKVWRTTTAFDLRIKAAKYRLNEIYISNLSKMIREIVVLSDGDKKLMDELAKSLGDFIEKSRKIVEAKLRPKKST